MDEVNGYSYTGIGNGVVVVIYWVGRRGECRNLVVFLPKTGKGSTNS